MADEAQGPATNQPARDARALLRASRGGTLATQSEGLPFASLITPATAPDGSVLMLLSGLSEHTRHLRDEPRCAWIDRDETEIRGLVGLATALIDELYHRTTGQTPPPRAAEAPASRRDQLRERDIFRALALAD